MKQIFQILFICLFLSGCGFITADLNLFRSGNWISDPPEEQAVNFSKAKEYIGKSKKEILDGFGSNIRYSTKDGLAINDYPPRTEQLHPLLINNLDYTSGTNSYYTVDEVGYYRFDAGVPILMPNQYGIYFYFIDDVCVYVSGS